jgi:Cell wall-associated hydrolases (invasion-associated proteins)
MRQGNIRRSLAVLLLAAVGYGAAGAALAEPASAATEQSKQLIEIGKAYIGTPYRMGGLIKNGEPVAFDCSLFTQHVYAALGVELPRTSKEQAKAGKKVDRGSISQGDLLFFRTNGKSISHVAIYVGNGKMIHASSHDGVKIADMNTNYWKKRFVTARRVL